MKRIVLVMALAVPLLAFGAELPKTLLYNGDFAAGLSRWKGDGKLEAVKAAAPEKMHILDEPKGAEERFLTVDLGMHPQKFSQHFTVPRGVKVLQLSFKLKTSADFTTSRPTLGAITLRFIRSNRNNTYRDLPVPVTLDWKEMNWNCPFTDDSKTGDLEIEVLPGTGKISFDDFVIQPLAG